MTTHNKRFDFTACEQRTADLATDAIIGGLRDIEKTLHSADAMDRANGTDSGGRYRDEASVYRRELARRDHFQVVGVIGDEHFELGLYTDEDEATARALAWRERNVPGAMIYVLPNGRPV